MFKKVQLRWQKDSKLSKADDVTLERVVDNVVNQDQEESPNIEISEQKELFKVPKRFGNVPVDELPLGYTKGREYKDKFPRIDLPLQKIEEISFGSPELEPNKLFWGDNLQRISNNLSVLESKLMLG